MRSRWPLQAQGREPPDSRRLPPANPGASVFPADFCRFAEMFPNFAEEYLYPKQTHSDSSAQTPLAPTPNGFCADFSPENSDIGRKPFRKKLD